MYFDYLIVLVFAAVGLLFVFANLVVASLIRPRRVGEVGLETYECGEETVGTAWVQFDVRYYTVALVYIVFAVEIAFLFPWALVLQDCLYDSGAAQSRGIGGFALIEGLLFGAILFLGLVYVWKKGDLDWVMSFRRAAPESAQVHKPVVMLGHNLPVRAAPKAVVEKH
jgi:NADH-quinone oxidoreductase subunit A